MFGKMLIANRGEIAVRILRACHELGIVGAAVYSEADRASLHVRLAAEAYCIGPAPSRESYLRIDKLIEVAQRAGCDSLHPGYGFLAENAALARACRDARIAFIGPTPEAMDRMGSKTEARKLARATGVATVPGTLEPIVRVEDALPLARDFGYPVLLKAVSGGGGKGMRRVDSEPEMAAAFRDAASEAQNAFGDGRLYLEKYLDQPRHVEIQVFGDHLGRVVALGERECSVQRRHQKVIEEAPSPAVDVPLRRSMCDAAVRLAKAGNYTNAGTLEFLLDSRRNFYFLEMNTRLQVEHPVTEMVTGLDLVKMQIRVAAGEPLRIGAELAPRGHAIECRIYAEDPDNNFFPSPGKILGRRVPAGPGVRLDDGVYPGWIVPTEYDPLLGKVIVWANDRSEAIARMRRALTEYSITGIRTNVGMFRRIFADPEFARGAIYTRWLDDWLARTARAVDPHESDSPAQDAALIAAALWHQSGGAAGHDGAASSAPAPNESRWKSAGRKELANRAPGREPGKAR